jgi:Holliday junction resolvase
MTGGAKAKAKGTRAENIMRDALRTAGYVVIRAWSSIGPWDLLALKAGSDGLMVQVKSGTSGAYMPPQERYDLLMVADQAGCVPILAYYPWDGKGMENATWQRLSDMTHAEEFTL